MRKRAGRWTALMLAAVMMMGVGAWAQAEETKSTWYDEMSKSIVGVYAMGEVWSREDGVSTVEKDYATGVYVDARGYVMTCWHLVEDADYVEVEFVSGERVRAESILSDNTVDVAVLKLEEVPEGLEPLKLAEENPAVGEAVWAIGNQYDAFGIYPSQVKIGHISGLNGDTTQASNFSRSFYLIRTDASLGLGSCGGALLSANGTIYGMLVRLSLDGTEVESGFASAIPASTLSKVVFDLIDYGSVRRPRMGVMVADNDGPEEAIKNYPPCGSLVTDIEAGGPADQAGMLVYDVITAIDGVRTHSFAEMSAELEKHNAGDVVCVTVYRCADPQTGVFLEEAAYLDIEVMLDVLD